MTRDMFRFSVYDLTGLRLPPAGVADGPTALFQEMREALFQEFFWKGMASPLTRQRKKSVSGVSARTFYRFRIATKRMAWKAGVFGQESQAFLSSLFIKESPAIAILYFQDVVYMS